MLVVLGRYRGSASWEGCWVVVEKGSESMEHKPWIRLSIMGRETANVLLSLKAR